MERKNGTKSGLMSALMASGLMAPAMAFGSALGRIGTALSSAYKYQDQRSKGHAFMLINGRQRRRNCDGTLASNMGLRIGDARIARIKGCHQKFDYLKPHQIRRNKT